MRPSYGFRIKGNIRYRVSGDRVFRRLQGHRDQREEKRIQTDRHAVLIVQIGTLRCALPLSCAIETLRPLPLQPVANTPEFVVGACVIRGEALPVVDLAQLLGAASAGPARFVVARAGARKVALAVDAVIGTEHVLPEAMASVPPLLAGARSEAIAALGTLDSELLLVLETARIVPHEVWTSIAES
jgi:purine-binding chemotaxis protein CheW